MGTALGSIIIFARPLQVSAMHFKQQNMDTQSIFMKSMDYAVCIILGNVIFNVAFQQADLSKVY